MVPYDFILIADGIEAENIFMFCIWLQRDMRNCLMFLIYWVLKQKNPTCNFLSLNNSTCGIANSTCEILSKMKFYQVTFIIIISKIFVPVKVIYFMFNHLVFLFLTFAWCVKSPNDTFLKLVLIFLYFYVDSNFLYILQKFYFTVSGLHF